MAALAADNLPRPLPPPHSVKEDIAIRLYRVSEKMLALVFTGNRADSEWDSDVPT
jgi:hypothetical protein